MISLISINTLCLDPAPLSVHVETVKRLGATAITPGVEEVELCGASQAAQLLGEAGLSVVALTHRSFGYVSAAEAALQRDRLLKSIDIAHAIGAQSICMTTGTKAGLSWKEAAFCFAYRAMVLSRWRDSCDCWCRQVIKGRSTSRSSARGWLSRAGTARCGVLLRGSVTH